MLDNRIIRGIVLGLVLGTIYRCTSTIVMIKAKDNATIESDFNKDVEIVLDSVNMLNWQPEYPEVEINSKKDSL